MEISKEEQRRNRGKIIKMFLLIIGSLFVGEGILAMFPESLDKKILFSIGFMLIIFSILTKEDGWF